MNLNNVFGNKGPKDDKSGAQKNKTEWKNFGKKEPKGKSKLISSLEQGILDANVVKQESPTMFRASSIGGCDRKQVYKLLGIEEDDISTDSFMIMNVGTIYHTLIQGYLKDCLESLEERVYFHPELLSGSYDGILKGELFPDGKRRLLEVKTTGYEHYERLCKMPKMLSNKYKIQATMYMECLGIEETVFLFINRNVALREEFKKENPDQHPFLLEIIYKKDPAMVAKLHEKIHNNKSLIDNYRERLALGPVSEDEMFEFLPPRETQNDCNYCSFNESGRCKADHEKQKEKVRLDKKKLKEK